MPEQWFTADWHLGHERIIELCGRPFDTVAEMNEALVDTHNAMVEPRDTVWMLGDMCMGPLEQTLALISRLHGYKILIAGNHDLCFHGTPENAGRRDRLAAQVRRYRDAGFSSVVTGQAIRVSGAPVAVPLRRFHGGPVGATVGACHFPPQGDSHDQDRFDRYRPRLVRKRDLPASIKAAGAPPAWTVHGHVHTAWTVRDQSINVGVDAWGFRPVHSDELLALIDRGAP